MGNGELFCKPTLVGFARGQAKDLERYLEEVERHTTICPVADPEELTLDHTGRTHRGNFRYTASSFRKIAQMFALGLSTFLPDLAGEVPKHMVDEDMIDAHLAREIFNNMANLRFDVLKHHRLLRNEKTKTIDGLVGQKHHSLENLTMLEQTDSAIASAAPDMEFHGGSVTGRKLTIWYRARVPFVVREIEGEPWCFYHGYYFRNSESTGTSVRGTQAVYTRRGACLRPFERENRVSHIGRGFTQRLNKMFQNIMSTEFKTTCLVANLDKMLTEPLGYAGLSDKEKKKFRTHFKRVIGGLGLTKTWAGKVLDDALAYGRADPTKLRMPLLSAKRFEERTLFDVFCPLVHMSRDLPIIRREIVQQVAYRVLNGKLEL